MNNMTKTSLGGDAIKLTISKMITIGISMISAMLLSRFRSLEEYGTYSQIMLVTNLITTLLMLGLPNSINYFLARTESSEERARFLSVYYTLSTILSIIIGLVLVCSTSLIVRYFNNELIKKFAYVLAVYPWTKVVMSSIENVLIIYKRTSTIMVYRIANSIALLFILLIVKVLNWDFQAYMLLFILVETVFTISVYLIVKDISKKFRITINKQLIRDILSFSIPIGLGSTIGTLNIELDKLMIGKFLGTEHLAIYTNASRELPITIVASSLTAVLLPQITRLLRDKENQKAINLWGSAIIFSYFIICFFATGFFIFAPDVMTLLYSQKYLTGVSIFRVYNVVSLLRCTYFGMVLNAKGKTSYIFYSSIASLCLNLILNYVMFLVFGLIGPAIATFISIFIINIFQLIATSRIIDVSFKDVFPWKKLLSITLLNVWLGVLFSLIKLLIPLETAIGSILESILLGILWACLYIKLNYKRIIQLWKKLKMY